MITKNKVRILLAFCLSQLVLITGKTQDLVSGDIEWISLEEAQIKMQTQPKPVFLYIYTDWCDNCNKMKETTFLNKNLIQYINKHYYPVQLNAESKDPVYFKGKYFESSDPANPSAKHQLALHLAVLDKTIGFPSYIFLNEDFDRYMKPLRGFKDIKTMEIYLRFIAENIYVRMSFSEYSSVFTPDF